MGIDSAGAYVRNQNSGFSIRVGDIRSEMIYDACERGDRFFEEDLKRNSAPLFGLFARWRF
jgi:hypothetical protein